MTRHVRGNDEQKVSVADLVKRAETAPLPRISRALPSNALGPVVTSHIRTMRQNERQPRRMDGIRWDPHTAIQVAGLTLVLMLCVFGVMIGNAKQEVPGAAQALDRATSAPATPLASPSSTTPGSQTTSATTAHPVRPTAIPAPLGSRTHNTSTPGTVTPRTTARKPAGPARRQRPRPTVDPNEAYASWASAVQRYPWRSPYWRFHR